MRVNKGDDLLHLVSVAMSSCMIVDHLSFNYFSNRVKNDHGPPVHTQSAFNRALLHQEIPINSGLFDMLLTCLKMVVQVLSHTDVGFRTHSISSWCDSSSPSTLHHFFKDKHSISHDHAKRSHYVPFRLVQILVKMSLCLNQGEYPRLFKLWMPLERYLVNNMAGVCELP